MTEKPERCAEQAERGEMRETEIGKIGGRVR